MFCPGPCLAVQYINVYFLLFYWGGGGHLDCFPNATGVRFGLCIMLLFLLHCKVFFQSLLILLGILFSF